MDAPDILDVPDGPDGHYVPVVVESFEIGPGGLFNVVPIVDNGFVHKNEWRNIIIL